MDNEKLSTKSLVIWFSAAIIIAVVIIGAIRLGGSKPGDIAVPKIHPELTVVMPSDNATGTTSAKTVLVEFSDFQCPACSYYFPILEKVATDYADRIQFVYKHFPLSQHKNAKVAAYAAEAAGKQGKFWEMYRLIFENQKVWSEKENSEATAIFESYAKTLKLDDAKFKSDFVSGDVKAKVDSDYNLGIKVGVNSTPTFYLNGKKMESPSNYDDFKKSIDAEIQ